MYLYSGNRIKTNAGMQILPPPLRRPVVTTIGVAVCASSAVLLCLVFRGKHPGAIVPVVFVVIVTLVAVRCGATAGILGSALAAPIFATFLYLPLGSVLVSDPAARMDLGWLVVGGVAFSYLLGLRNTGSQQHH